jgi:hypothetical protein
MFSSPEQYLWFFMAVGVVLLWAGLVVAFRVPSIEKVLKEIRDELKRGNSARGAGA